MDDMFWPTLNLFGIFLDHEPPASVDAKLWRRLDSAAWRMYKGSEPGATRDRFLRAYRDFERLLGQLPGGHPHPAVALAREWFVVIAVTVEGWNAAANHQS
jgi:hypothetical protein